MSIINFETQFRGVETPVVTKTIVTTVSGLNTSSASPYTVGQASAWLFGAGSIITNIDVFGTCSSQNVLSGVTFSINATNSTPFSNGNANTLVGQQLYASLGGTFTVPGSQLCSALPQDSWLQVISNATSGSTVSDPLNLCVTYLAPVSYSN